MKLKKLKPITNGTRHQVNLEKSLLSKTNKLSKASILGIKKHAGKSATTGRTTVWHKGGACKSNYRQIDFSKKESDSIVICVMYDPKRSSFISLNFDFKKQTLFRSLATSYVYPGSLISCTTKNKELFLGHRTLINNIPAGSVVHSVTNKTSDKTVFARSAGTFCQIIQKQLNSCKVRLPSGLVTTMSSDSFVTLGVVSNPQQNLICIGKAGRNRLKGVRPTVRGVAMNPVDHPHGGRTNGGRPSVTPWGIPTKGKPTVKKIKK